MSSSRPDQNPKLPPALPVAQPRLSAEQAELLASRFRPAWEDPPLPELGVDNTPLGRALSGSRLQPPPLPLAHAPQVAQASGQALAHLALLLQSSFVPQAEQAGAPSPQAMPAAAPLAAAPPAPTPLAAAPQAAAPAYATPPAYVAAPSRTEAPPFVFLPEATSYVHAGFGPYPTPSAAYALPSPQRAELPSYGRDHVAVRDTSPEERRSPKPRHRWLSWLAVVSALTTLGAGSVVFFRSASPSAASAGATTTSAAAETATPDEHVADEKAAAERAAAKAAAEKAAAEKVAADKLAAGKAAGERGEDAAKGQPDLAQPPLHKAPVAKALTQGSSKPTKAPGELIVRDFPESTSSN